MNLEKSYPEFLLRYLPPERLNEENLHYYEYEGRRFYRLKKDTGEYPRGTVFTDRGFVMGYQRIKRIINLKAGLQRNMNTPFYVEEKMDGYNVRIRRLGDTLYTFTRGGFVCPFTIDRVGDFIPLTFFDRYPNYTLCVEVVGPENPYNSEQIPYMERDVQFFAFDLKDPLGTSLPPEKRYRILEEAGIEGVRRWGPFSREDYERIADIIWELDRQGREGIVIKALDGKTELKYVTLTSCIKDIEATAHLMVELSSGFYTQRIIRLAAIIEEFGIELSEKEKIALSDAFLMPLKSAMRSVLETGYVKEHFRVRVNKRKTVDALIRHLKNTGTKVEIESIHEEGGRFVLSFYRLFPKGSKILRQRLRGQGFYD